MAYDCRESDDNFGSNYDPVCRECSQHKVEIKRLRDVLLEISLPPFDDSDLRSLLEWCSARARAALEE